MITAAEAQGELAEAYAAMRKRPMPAVYLPPHGDAANIQRAHSLDPALMMRVFAGMSSSLGAAGPLTWPQRELINTVTSRVNQCLY